jgi:TolA-binding protein
MDMQEHRTRARLAKEEVREDEFLTWVYRAVDYVEKNYPKFIAGVGAVALAGLVAWFVKSNSEKEAQAAVDAVGQVQVQLMQGNTRSAIQQAERVVAEYAGKPAAASAQLLLASAYFNEGRYDESAATFQAYLDRYSSEGPQGYGAWAGLAACLEQKGDFSGAARKYLAYADASPRSPFAPISLKEAARCFELGSSREDEVKALQRIVSEYPKSDTRREAEGILRVLGVDVD